MIQKPSIFACSTGSGRAGIAVVRVSGPQAKQAIESLAAPLPEPRRVSFRTIKTQDGSMILDRGLVVWFQAPHSATGEDVVEFQIHGGPAVVEVLLRELSNIDGLIPAGPGDFSRRAFENGVLDLVEIEGLADLLAAETEAQRRIAMRQFSGEASSVYEQWRARLVQALAYLEASIDFADEDGVAETAVSQVRPIVSVLRDDLLAALQASQQSAAVRRGLRVVIAGAPNVGKSSLLNALVGRSAAIVSPIAGTTRDVVAAAMVIDGVPISVSDTAGLRASTNDAIEKQGIERSHTEIAAADILVWVTNADQRDDAAPPRKPDVLVLNKADLGNADSIQVRNEIAHRVSAKTGAGMAELKKSLTDLVQAKTSVASNAVMVRLRHSLAVEESIRFLNDALEKDSGALELMAEDVRKAASALASITGRVGVEELLGQIFSEFCIGK
jgi:tRNA modification GTPase